MSGEEVTYENWAVGHPQDIYNDIDYTLTNGGELGQWLSKQNQSEYRFVMEIESVGSPITKYHVSESGQDYYNGAELSPFATIQHGIDVADEGDTVFVFSGTFIENINFYGKNIINESTLIKGVKEFLMWCKNQNISMAVCTNKQEHLSNDLLKKIGIYDFFEYVAGSDTFDYCKPDPRHLTSVVEILDGDVNKTIMIGDSETDANAAKAAEIPVILLENGYTEKNTTEIYHNHLIKDFIGIEKIISEYL